MKNRGPPCHAGGGWFRQRRGEWSRSPRRTDVPRSDACSAPRRGEVLNRRLIWEHLFDEESETTPHVVDETIRHLRDKVDRGFSPPLITTTLGDGYQLRGD